MKRFTSLYYIALSALLMMTACQSDETTELGGELQKDGKVAVRLHISPAGSQTANAKTRAWTDGNATDDEMMNIWTVVIVNDADDKVVEIQSCRPSSPYAEIDDITTLPTGTYRFYSFANISAAGIESLLSLPSGAVPVVAAETEDVIASIKVEDFNPPTGTTGMGTVGGDNSNSPATNIKATINGNNFDPTVTNNYGEKGIPMSNVQRLTIAEAGTYDLIVVRMVAKIEVQVYNDGDEDVTIESISLTDVTKNADNNLKLLPSLTAGANTMESMGYLHKDIQPNLGAVPSEATRANLTYIPAEGKRTVAATGHKSGSGTPVTFTFYVNESVAPDNGSGLFYLSLGIKKGTNPVEYSHALINQDGKTAADNGAWDYIARNDYRIIPVVLTDWLFRIEPIAFTPIAGYPAVAVSSDAHKATFSTGGFIALKPYVKKRTDANWRDFSDPEVQVVSVSWKNSDTGTNQENPAGDGMIIRTPFTYDSSTNYIIGELNPNKTSNNYTTAITVTVKLGPSGGDQYTYSFTCDVILQ